jgi:RNA polymerase sigma-70 factor (ECF subfamily)
MAMRSTAWLTAEALAPGAPERAPADVPAQLRIEDVYEAHFDFVWRTARRLGAGEQHVDDVVQEVFLVVQRRLPDFEGRSELKTWLFGITRRVLRGYLRRHGPRARDCDQDAAELPDARAPSAEAQLVALEGSRLLQALLDELDEDKREVFVLCELEELSGPQIAEALELSLSNVYARIRGARQAFDAALRRHQARQTRQR